jgi:signal transduction histidine kinase
MTREFKQRTSLKYKLLLGFIPVVIFLCLFVFYAISLNNNINSSFSRINNSFNHLTDISNLSNTVKSLSEVAKAYVNTNDSSWEKQYNDLLFIFNKSLEESLVSESSKDGRLALEEFKKITNSTQKTELSAIQRVKAGDSNGAKYLFDSRYANDILLSSKLLYTFINAESDNVSHEIGINQNYLVIQIVLFISFAVLFLFITLLIIVRLLNGNILQPLEKLAETAKIIANGDMSSRAEIVNPDEVGSLANNFNVMIARLESSHAVLSMTVEDLSKANKELKKIDKMKSDFVTIAAHQLRTPLTGIKWSLTAILNGDMGLIGDDQKEYLRGAVESNERMINTVDQILKMDNLQAGIVEIKDDYTDLVTILNSVLFDIYPQAARKKIKLNLDFDKEEKLMVNIDQESLRVVLQNLLENSVLYSNEKENVNVTFKKEEGSVLFSVSDFGIGIPEGEKKNVFTKFFRATNAIKHYANGSGLGLIVSKNIVDRHGGKIWFESKEGAGTTFFVSLPTEEWVRPKK